MLPTGHVGLFNVSSLPCVDLSRGGSEKRGSNFGRREPVRVSVRFMTYNIRSARGMDGRLNLERIARVIRAENPDIVALQEVDFNRPRTRRQDQALELASLLGYHHAFEAARSWPGSEYGNALLSRFPLVDCRRICLPKPARMPVEARCLMQCVVESPEGLLSVWNTHLGLLAGERRAQVELLVRHLEENSSLPVVLCGDFNARPQAKELKGIGLHLARVPSQRTFPGILPVIHLDHVFHSRHLEVVKSFVPKSLLARSASDHLPLIVDLNWTGLDQAVPDPIGIKLGSGVPG